MPIAQTVEDTVLGEALAGDYADMLGIVSVIDNRSRQLGVSYQDVVSVPSEFNAYGKALPAGVGKYRDLARQAIAEVREKGPVHAATFYATPAAEKGLPKGLAFETQTAGHNYYSDPKGRAIGTAQGYKTPDPAAVAETRNVAGDPSGTLYDVVEARQQAAPTATAAPSFAALPEIGPTPMGRPSQQRGLGLAALATPADMSRVASQAAPAATRGLMSFSPPSTAVRSQAVDPGLTGIVETAVSRLGPEYGWETTSGGQPAIGTSTSRVGSTRHDRGMAIDGYVTRDGVALNPVDDRQAYMDTLTNLAEAGAQGLGHYGWGIHADVAAPASWGPTTSRASLDPGFGLAIDQGRALSGLQGGYPTPLDKAAPVGPVERGPLADVPGVAPTFAAPVGPVERSPLADVTAPAIGPTAPASFAPASILGEIAMPTVGPTFAPMAAPTAPTAPSFSVPAAVPTPTANPMRAAQAPVGPTTAPRAAPPSIAQVSIPGPLGPQTRAQTAAPAIGPMRGQQTGFGMAARGVAGGLAGAMVGGALMGPLGGMLGGYLGRQMAQGKIGRSRSTSPAAARAAFARGFTPGLGFPTAPVGPSSQGGLTAFGDAAARGEFGGQAQTAANNPGRGLY